MNDDDNPTDDLTIRLLRGLRARVEETTTDLNAFKAYTGARFDRIDTRLDLLRDDLRGDLRDGLAGLGRGITTSETRLMTEIREVHATMEAIRGLLSDRLDLRDRVTRVEHDVADLKQRL